MTKRFKLPVPILTDDSTYITIVFTDNYAGFVKRNLKEHYVEGETETDLAAFYTTSDSRDYMVFDISQFHGENTIVHECVHAAAAILIHNGIWLTKDTEETYALTIEHLFNKINSYWKKVKSKINGEVGNSSNSKLKPILRNVSTDTGSDDRAN